MSRDIFSALADPTRRSILEMLTVVDELPASEIHNKYQYSPQAISQHLKILREANLVCVEKKAQQRIYRLNTDTMSIFDQWIKNMMQKWNHRLETMETILIAEMKKTNNDRNGEIKMNQNAEKKTIIINRVFDIPVELVWNAWTDPNLVMKWWGPINFTSPRCEIDFREGGKYLFCMRAPAEMGGQESFSTGIYTKISPLKRLEFTQSMSDKEGNIINPSMIGLPDFPEKIEFVIEFKARGNQTELIIKEDGWKVGQMAEFAEIGMNQSLDKITASI